MTLDSSGLKEGDYAGLCALQGRYGQIGIAVENGKKNLLYLAESCRRQHSGIQETDRRGGC